METVKVVYTGSLPAVVFEGGEAVRGVPVDVPGPLAARLCEQRSWNYYDGLDPDDLEGKTKDELREMLDAQGIVASVKLTKAELIDLLQPESEES